MQDKYFREIHRFTDIYRLVDRIYRPSEFPDGLSPDLQASSRHLLAAAISFVYYRWAVSGQTLKTVDEILSYAYIEDDDPACNSYFGVLIENLQTEGHYFYLPPKHDGRVCVKIYEAYIEAGTNGKPENINLMVDSVRSALNTFIANDPDNWEDPGVLSWDVQ